MQHLPRLSSDALTAHLDDETVVLHLRTKQYYHLNASGQRIWELLDEGVTQDVLVQRLCDEFDVTPEIAAREVHSLCETLRQYGLVEDDPTPSAE